MINSHVLKILSFFYRQKKQELQEKNKSWTMGVWVGGQSVWESPHHWLIIYIDDNAQE